MYEPYYNLLDTDLYKFSMGQLVFNQYPDVNVKYEFKCRTKGIRFTESMIYDIKQMLNQIRGKHVSVDQFDFISKIPYIKYQYKEWLEALSKRACGVFGESYVEVKEILDDPAIEIIAYGPWKNAIFWEVHVLSVVNEVYFKHTCRENKDRLYKQGEKILAEKVEMLKEYPFLKLAEFGTRRRFSAEWQEYVVYYLSENCKNLVGTSNMYFAYKYGLKPIGTMAHEYISAHLQLVPNIKEAQKRALYVWLQEYDGDLGIALTDTFTTDAFFKDFGKTLTRSFDGLRHDSGCPYEFGEKAIKHYESMGVDPLVKTLVFSDGLDIQKAIEIYKHFNSRIKVSFGIGTNLTNDLGVEPINIVMKLVEVNGGPVIKLSDNIQKAIGDMEMIKKIKQAYYIR
jgi:nicotinate phosphoribosyltransferase